MNADRDPEAAAWERARRLRVERDEAEQRARDAREDAVRASALEAERSERAGSRRSLVFWCAVGIGLGALVVAIVLVVADRAADDDAADPAVEADLDDQSAERRLAPVGPDDGPGQTGRRASPTLDADTPPVVDLGGDNFDTVWRQAQVLEGWLLRHPDPAVVGQIYAEGTPTYDEVYDYIDELARSGRAVVVEDYRIIEVALVQRRSADEVELRYADTYAFRELVDRATNEVLDHEASDGQPRAWTLVLRRGVDGQWRVVSIAPASG